MPILKHVLAFAQTRKPWEQDLMRRICTSDELRESDVAQAYELLKADIGLTALPAVCTPEPLTRFHIPVERTTTSTTRLHSLSDVANVNRLASGQKLLFALHGLTVVYGDNGSGKSGYCRVLKQMCRARQERTEPILNDVYQSQQRVPVSAIVTFSIDNEDPQTVCWTDPDGAVPQLGRISVFDASCAPLYADKQSQIEFLPHGLDILPRLGGALETIRGRLDVEITAINRAISAPLISAPTGTVVACLLARLTPSTPAAQLPPEAEIQQLGRWTEDDGAHLKNTEQLLQKLSEPGKQAGTLRRMKGALTRVRAQLHQAEQALNRAAMEPLRAIVNHLLACQAAVRLASEDRFQTEPLGGYIASQAWRLLFESARRFSEVAYPGDPFPATGEGRVCVLCQQPLGNEASERLARFNAYITDDTQQKLVTAQETLRIAESSLRTLTLPPAEQIKEDLAEYSAHSPDSATMLEAMTEMAERLKRRNDDTLVALSQLALSDEAQLLSVAVLDECRRREEELEVEAKKYDLAGLDAEPRKAAESQRAELNARRLLSEVLPTVLDRRRDLLVLSLLQIGLSQCDTRAISLKNSELRSRYITGDFQLRIHEEVKALKLDYLPIKVDAKTDRGVSLMGVALEKKAQARTSHILSEGEFRGLALAGFFAEIGGIPGNDGIIVDDPVSSLDHMHIRQVAERLVLEAMTRPQVVVFTHDLAFYYDIYQSASEQNVPFLGHWVSRSGQGTGIVAVDDSPWEIKSVKERLAHLDNQLKALPKETEVPPDLYRESVRSFYSNLRETWERLVEERLLNKVVGRFQTGVGTQALREVEVGDNDHKVVFHAMRRVSEFSGHDRAVGRQTSLPTRDAMKTEIDNLRSYFKELSSRSDTVRKRRAELEGPGKAKTA